MEVWLIIEICSNPDDIVPSQNWWHVGTVVSGSKKLITFNYVPILMTQFHRKISSMLSLR
jgi:hypothetical protein